MLGGIIIPKMNMAIVYQILEEENAPYLLPKKTILKNKNKNKLNTFKYKQNKIYIPKPKISYKDYVLTKIKTYNDLINNLELKNIFLMSFVYNSGTKNIKNYNNRCEFKIRVNKKDIPVIKVFLLNKFEIEQTLSLLKNLKEVM